MIPLNTCCAGKVALAEQVHDRFIERLTPVPVAFPYMDTHEDPLTAQAVHPASFDTLEPVPQNDHFACQRKTEKGSRQR